MLIIKNARIIDPSLGLDNPGDLYIDGGFTAGCSITGENFSPGPDDEIIDGSGLIAAPGLVDMHVHFRDPGFTYKEDILTGAEAAAAGGVTTVVCMPNTKPVADSVDTVNYIMEKGLSSAVHVLSYGAVTVGEKGQELTDFEALKNAGAVALSDDGAPIQRAVIEFEAQKKALPLNLMICSHCEDGEMVGNRGANEGKISEILGIPGRPSVAEDIMAARDIMLAGYTGAHIHICHVSTAGTVNIIREGKKRGINVTAETCPQYFTLTEDALLTKGTMARVNPPLRTPDDKNAVIAGLKDGTLDVLVTDHAPHSAEEKAAPLAEAPSGMVGLETSLAIALTELYHKGLMSISDIIRLMSLNPSRLLELGTGTLKNGACADVVIFDPDEEWIIDPEKFRSKGKNTPFAGMKVRGRVKYTIVSGKVVYKDE